jgi:hypothetical protein
MLKNEDDDNKTLNYLLANILCAVSVALSFLFILMIKRKDSNYARIVRHIVMSEGMSIFCFLNIISREDDKIILYIKSMAKKFFAFVTFNLFTDYEKDFQDYFYFDMVNLAIYYSMEAFSLTFSIFICLELILILKNPIAQMKSRFKPYFIFCFFLAISIFVMILTIPVPEDAIPTKVDYFFYDIFQM